MIRAFNLDQTQDFVDGNLASLELYLQQLIGEPFLFAHESYAGEMTIHLGVARQRDTTKLKDRLRGSYVLSVRGSLWMVISSAHRTLTLSDQPSLSPDAQLVPLSESDVGKSPPIAPGSRLIWAQPFLDETSGGIGVAMGFFDGARIIVRPDRSEIDTRGTEPPALSEVADWELLTPFSHYLRVGPGSKWAYLPIDSQSKRV